VIVGLDARGFLLAPTVALRLNAAFVPVRKRGKLPGECVSAEYEKEYGIVSLFFFFLFPFEGLGPRWLCAPELIGALSVGYI